MNDWYERSMKALQLNGLADRTKKTYTRAVRQLVDFYGKAPDLIGEEELQDYFLHCKNVLNWSSSSLRICYSGIRFFFVNVLERQWHTFDYLRAKREYKLPSVIDVEEVRRICPALLLPTTMPISPPSIPVACAFRKDSIWKFPTSTAAA